MEERKLPGENYQVKGQVLIYYMPKEVDHHAAGMLCKELDILIESHIVKELIMDFGKTEFMDSSGIGVIIGRGKLMQFREGKIYAANLGKRVRMIFETAGLDKLVEIKEEM